MITTTRGGRYWRIADPSWTGSPFDGSWSMRFGGRWNAKGSHPVVYLNADLATAVANAERHVQATSEIGVLLDDLDPAELPVAVPCVVPESEVVDVVSAEGVAAAGLPVTYPYEASGEIVPHASCQGIGAAAFAQGHAGIACRSATGSGGEELAWFDRAGARLAADGDPVSVIELQ